MLPGRSQRPQGRRSGRIFKRLRDFPVPGKQGMPNAISGNTVAHNREQRRRTSHASESRPRTYQAADLCDSGTAHMNSKKPSGESFNDILASVQANLDAEEGLPAGQLALLLAARPEVSIPVKLVERIVVQLRDGPKKRGRPRRNEAAADFLLGDGIADIYREELRRIQRADAAEGKVRGRESPALRAAQATLDSAGKLLPTIASPEALLNLLSEYQWLGRARGRRRAPREYPED